jgi:hypothetical protein
MTKGLLLVTMEPPAGLEEEFNDWYDTEHFPQRCGLPGFESGSRWACLEGWPRWIALYDLAAVSVLESPAYLAVSGSNSTPWSKRILPRTLGRQRVIAEQLAPGAEILSTGATGIARLLVVRYPDIKADTALLQQRWVKQAGVTTARLFRDTEAAIWLIVGFARHVTLAELAAGISAAPADLVNLYAPYRR